MALMQKQQISLCKNSKSAIKLLQVVLATPHRFGI
jgi:hypothetical protein